MIRSGVSANQYSSNRITPEQQSLLNGNNPHQYTAEREVNERKVTNSASDNPEEGAEISLGVDRSGGGPLPY